MFITFFLEPLTKPGYRDVTMHTLNESLSMQLRLFVGAQNKQVWATLFHPRADGPFPLSLPLFLRHRQDTLAWLFYLFPSTKNILFGDNKYQSNLVAGLMPGKIIGPFKSKLCLWIEFTVQPFCFARCSDTPSEITEKVSECWTFSPVFRTQPEHWTNWHHRTLQLFNYRTSPLFEWWLYFGLTRMNWKIENNCEFRKIHTYDWCASYLWKFLKLYLRDSSNGSNFYYQKSVYLKIV